MHLAPTERQQELRAELRAYFGDVMPKGGGHAPAIQDPDAQRRLLRRIGADGMLGLGWPVECGGKGRGADEQFVFFDEAYRAGAPVSMVTLNTVGPTLMKYGTEAQKAYFLPRILAGELVFAIGYSEPEAGTDLAALRTRAVRDGDSWAIDGQKIFTSNAQNADWIWLACRTDPDVPKHKGISIVLVPTDAPGFSWTPIETVGGLTTTATYYDGVRVPATSLVGEENGGWGLITNQLNHERVALAAIGMQAEDFYDAALAFARTADPVTGRRPADEPWVRSRLAETHARLAATRLLNWRLVGDVGAGALAPGDASGVKFAGTESAVEVYRMCQEITGDTGMIRGGSPGTFGDGELERMNRAAQINTFGGGVSEVQREIVATMRLGMKRGEAVTAGQGGQDELYERLRAYEGRAAATSGVGKDLVNEPMIRHWCEAVGDTHPAYTGPGAVAPPTMLQAWTMGGLSGHSDRSGAYDELFGLLDGAGYTSVVATDCEQEYLRPLRPGDRITFDAVIEAVSERKTTKLGTGYFVTTRMDVRAQDEPAGTHRFRILKYRPAKAKPGVKSVRKPVPKSGLQSGSKARLKPEPMPMEGPERKLRSRPVVNRDNAGFWEGVAAHRLLIQRCTACDTLRFPWLPGCNACGSPEWDTVEASGEGTVFSHVVMHHPPFPAFSENGEGGPYAVALIELSEGVRMVSNVIGVPCDKVRAGMPVRLEFLRTDPELVLPVFRGSEG